MLPYIVRGAEVRADVQFAKFQGYPKTPFLTQLELGDKFQLHCLKSTLKLIGDFESLL